MVDLKTKAKTRSKNKQSKTTNKGTMLLKEILDLLSWAIPLAARTQKLQRAKIKSQQRSNKEQMRLKKVKRGDGQKLKRERQKKKINALN